MYAGYLAQATHAFPLPLKRRLRQAKALLSHPGGIGIEGRRTRGRQHVVAGLVLLAGLVPLLLSACGPQATGNAALAADQTFIYPYTRTNDIKQVVLDPAAVAYAADSTFSSMLFSGLVTYAPDLTVVGDAATTWDIDSTGKVYTFHLRPDMHFSDGAPLTATDFAYSINRALDPHLCDKLDSATYGPKATGFCGLASATGYLGHIAGAVAFNEGSASPINGTGNDPHTSVNVLDPLTLQIRLDAPIAYFLEALTYPMAFPVEKKLIDRYPNGTWVQHLDEGGTNGPFKVAQYNASAKPQTITLEPNPYWEQAWGKKLTLTKVIRPLYASVDDEYADYRSGKYDYTDVPVASYYTARGQSDFFEVPQLSEVYFGLNFDLAPFNNLQVRQAFALALNKQYMVDRVENGGAIPTNHIVPRGMPGYYTGLLTPGSNPTQSLTGNQAEAQQLLKAAQSTCGTINPTTGLPPKECPYITGSNPRPIVITVSNGNQTRVDLANNAATQWSAVLGLNVQVNAIDPDEFGQHIIPNGPYQMWILGWLADYPDPQDWLSLQFMSNPPGVTSSNNTSDISDPKLDQIMQQADVERDPAKRMALYNQAEQMAINEVAWIPFQQGKSFWRMRPWVRGFGLNPIGMMVDIAWPNVYITNH